MSGKPTEDKPADHPADAPQAQADRAAEDAPGDLKPDEDLAARQDKLLDEAVEETFPASDPISPKRIT